MDYSEKIEKNIKELQALRNKIVSLILYLYLFK